MQRFSTLVIGLALLHLGGCTPTADPIETFYASGYTLCDAHVLYTVFDGPSMDDVKIAAGLEIQNGLTSATAVRNRVETARQKVLRQRNLPSCDWDMALEWNDVEAIARMWNVPPDDAKATIEGILTAGGTSVMQAVAEGLVQLDPSPRPGSGEPVALDPLPDEADYAYDDCDRRLAAYGWHLPAGGEDASQRFQSKIAYGFHNDLIEAIASGTQKVQNGLESPCGFLETRYGYDDAVLLAEFWETDITETKTRIAREASTGHRTFIDGKLRNLRSGGG